MKVFLYAVFLALGVGMASVSIPHFVFAPAPLQKFLESSQEEATIIFVGDIMLDRFIRTKAEAFGEGHTLGHVKEFLMSADMVVGNLEGPVTTYDSVSQKSVVGDKNNMRFTFASTSAKLLSAHNIRLVSIGNNHIFDFGREGVQQTKMFLQDAGISYVGDPEAPSDVVIQKLQGMTFAFVAYNEFFGQKISDLIEVLTATKSQKNIDAIIVMAHWGEEYVSNPSEKIREKARAFIDAGATLVIGSHPHVVQPFEDYQDGRIYYSLGNFIFDQYWSAEVRCGMAVTATFTKNRISYREQEIGMGQDGRTTRGCS